MPIERGRQFNDSMVVTCRISVWAHSHWEGSFSVTLICKDKQFPSF